LQALATGETVRAIHGASYTRLYNADLLTMVREFLTDFVPPQPAGMDGIQPSVTDDDIPFVPDPEPTPTSGLYCGEQDMFCFLIDPTGWAEIEGEAFAPGFFIWNSEVGKRSVGVQTFWFQAVCQNHIVWDAAEVVEFSRKHTANVHDSLREIRRLVEGLVDRRDARRDGFVNVMRKAMGQKLGDDADEVLKVLNEGGITKKLAKEALEIARQRGGFTIFALVDALVPPDFAWHTAEELEGFDHPGQDGLGSLGRQSDREGAVGIGPRGEQHRHPSAFLGEIDVDVPEIALEPLARLMYQWDERLALPATMLADVPANLIIAAAIVVLAP
jgi:hypothetical protein